MRTSLPRRLRPSGPLLDGSGAHAACARHDLRDFCDLHDLHDLHDHHLRVQVLASTRASACLCEQAQPRLTSLLPLASAQNSPMLPAVSTKKEIFVPLPSTSSPWYSRVRRRGRVSASYRIAHSSLNSAVLRFPGRRHARLCPSSRLIATLSPHPDAYQLRLDSRLRPRPRLMQLRQGLFAHLSCLRARGNRLGPMMFNIIMRENRGLPSFL